MLDRLPLSLQHHVLLEWLSPYTVFVVAHAGSSSLRAAVQTSPCPFRAAEGEILSEDCVRWFHRREMKLVLWTSVGNNWRGDIIHKRNGKFHRDEDLPAVIWKDGSKFWFQDDKLHRDGDQPAEIRADGTQQWYQNGQCHRDGDRPAVVYGCGSRYWYQKDKLHRDNDLPAAVRVDGTQEWYQNGELHRDDDKPASVRANGARAWYQRGVFVRID